MPPVAQTLDPGEAVKIARESFASELRSLGIAADQIEGQTLEELSESLKRVDKALENPDAFGLVNIVRMSGDNGLVGPADEHFTVGILPCLLECKRQILARISEYSGQSAEALIEHLAQLQGAPSVDDIAKALNLVRDAHSAAQQEAELNRSLAVQRERIALYERKAKVVQSFIARESIASIVGSLLLLMFAVTLIVAMFRGTTVTEVVQSAFLIILGYFFGQSAGRTRDGTDDAPSE